MFFEIQMQFISTPCPALAQITALQATYFNNGAPKYPTTKNPVSGKRKNNRPQHVLGLDVWTAEPDQIDLLAPQWESNVILVRRDKLIKRLPKWLADGSVSAKYHGFLAALAAGASDETYIGPVFDKAGGTNYLDYNFVVAVIEHGAIQQALFVIGADQVDLKFVPTYCNGVGLKGNAQAQARLSRSDFIDGWATC